MPLPLARCAFSRSSGGTSIVILREVGMTPQYTISDTSIEYGLAAGCLTVLGGTTNGQHIPRVCGAFRRTWGQSQSNSRPTIRVTSRTPLAAESVNRCVTITPRSEERRVGKE